MQVIAVKVEVAIEKHHLRWLADSLIDSKQEHCYLATVPAVFLGESRQLLPQAYQVKHFESTSPSTI